MVDFDFEKVNVYSILFGIYSLLLHDLPPVYSIANTTDLQPPPTEFFQSHPVAVAAVQSPSAVTHRHPHSIPSSHNHSHRRSTVSRPSPLLVIVDWASIASFAQGIITHWTGPDVMLTMLETMTLEDQQRGTCSSSGPEQFHSAAKDNSCITINYRSRV